MSIDELITKNRQDLLFNKTGKRFQKVPYNLQTMINRNLKISEFLEKDLREKINHSSIVDENKISIYTKQGCRVLKIRISFKDNNFEYKLFEGRKLVLKTNNKYSVANKIAELYFKITKENKNGDNEQ